MRNHNGRNQDHHSVDHTQDSTDGSDKQKLILQEWWVEADIAGLVSLVVALLYVSSARFMGTDANKQALELNGPESDHQS